MLPYIDAIRLQALVPFPADVTAAVAAGELTDPLPLRAVLEGAAVDRTRPRVFRSVGMAWEDLAVAQVALTPRPVVDGASAPDRSTSAG